jgi:hypothetical protein
MSTGKQLSKRRELMTREGLRISHNIDGKSGCARLLSARFRRAKIRNCRSVSSVHRFRENSESPTTSWLGPLQLLTRAMFTVRTTHPLQILQTNYLTPPT